MGSALEHRLLNRLQRASKEYGLLAPDDRVMVCMSGGKDSYALLRLLMVMQKRLPFDLSIVAVNLDQAHPGFPKDVLPRYFEEVGVEWRVIERDTLSIVKEKIPEGGTYCSLCSRLRRGILYDTATELGATKIALGHHMDDIIETALLNLFFGGKIGAMPPKLLSDDGRHVVIRPLSFVPEQWIEEYSEEQQFPIIPCNLCGSQETLQRQNMKQLVNQLCESNPLVRGNMLAALKNVSPSHLLDKDLYAACGVATDRGTGRTPVNSPAALEDEISLLQLAEGLEGA